MNLPRIITENCYAVIDIETTGMSNKTAQAVQLGVAQMDFGKPRWRAFCTIRPTVPMSPGAERVHGLSERQLVHSPLFADLAMEILQLIGDRTLLGYNIAAYDYPILKRQFAEAGVAFKLPVVDVLLWDRKLVPGVPHGMEEVAARLGVPTQRHDALADCRTTWGIFAKLAAAFPELGDADHDAITKAIKSEQEEVPA